MKAEVFTKPGCPYCVAAKQLLVRKNIPYVERDITRRPDWDELKSRVPAFRTVPQIFLDGRHVGGFDDLSAHFRRQTAEMRPGQRPEGSGLADRLRGIFRAPR
jgi:glutaredoxin 3